MSVRHDHSPRALIRSRRRQMQVPRKRGLGLTPRVRKAIEAIIFGIGGEPVEQPVTFKDAADHANLTPRALRAALSKPAVLAHFREQVQLLREGERAANLRTAISIRDDAALKASAAGQKVRLEAAKQLDCDIDNPRSPLVNVQVNAVMPGYVIDLSEPEPQQTIEHVENPNPADSESLAGA